MTTSALITLIQKKAPDWSTDNIRELINEVQNIILTEKPVESLRIYSTTGGDPTLTAVSGTYEYTINTTNGFPYDAFVVTGVYENEDYPDTLDDTVKVIPGTPSAAAKVMFSENPSGTYYVKCYRAPTQITSISTALTVPAAYHVTVVMEGVVGLIEQLDNGNSARWHNFEDILKHRVRASQNDQPWYPTKMPLRGF